MLDYPHQNNCINLWQTFMLIWMQKINFVIRFFLKILQRNSKLVILGNLGMPGHTHLNNSINLKKPLTFIFRPKINFITPSFLEILQRYANFYFGYFQHAWLNTPNMIVSTCRRLQCLICMPKMNFIILFFFSWDITI